MNVKTTSRTPVARVRPRVLAAVLLVLGCLPVATVHADTPPVPSGTEAGQEPRRDPYDAVAPAGAVRSFIDACRAGDYGKAARFLNLEPVAAERRAAEGPDLARRLKVVLDRKLWIHYEQLSDRPEGDPDDGLPEDLDRVPGSDDLQVYLERMPDGSDPRIWRFSASTVERIPDLYERYGYGPLGEILPERMFEIQFLEIQLWQWIGLVVLVFLAYLVSWIAVRIVHRLARPLVDRTDNDLDDVMLLMLLPPLRLAFAVLFFTLGSYLLRLSVPAYELLEGVEKALAVIAMTWLALRAVDLASSLFHERLLRDDNRTAVAVLPLGRRAVKVFLLAVAGLAALQNLGFNVTGLIAGLGVGGLAVALAAQKTVANLFGGISMVMDQPVRVGETCKFGDKAGTVEEIGLRSTRVRTLDRTVITVPNAEFSEVQLENLTARDKMRLHAMIGLRYETTPEQLRFVLADLRRMLLSHPKIDSEPFRVRFVGFGAHSLDLEVMAYVPTRDWSEFLAVREDVYLRIMDVVEQAGSGFAFPSQTLYLGRDGGIDEERAREAEARVGQWRQDGALPFPDYTPEMIEEFRSTADYPPRGSVVPAPPESPPAEE